MDSMILQRIFKVGPASRVGHRFCTEVEGVVERESRGYNDFTMGGPIVKPL
jgi:hypothetical protein